MKTNEIIKESEQIDEFGEKVVGGLKGLLKGDWRDGRAGWQGGQGQQIANRSSDVSIRQWNNAVGQLQQAGQQPTMDQLKAFVKKQAPTHTIPDPKGTGPEFAEPYIRSAVAQHIANKNIGMGAAQQPADPAQEKQTAADTGATPEQPTAATPAAPAAPAQKLMGKQEIMSWISRNSEDYATLKSFADGIGVAASPAPAAPAKAAAPEKPAAKPASNPASNPATPAKAAAPGEPAAATGTTPPAQSSAPTAEPAATPAPTKFTTSNPPGFNYADAAKMAGVKPVTPAPKKVGPGVMPQMTVAPSKVTYNMPAAAPAKKPAAAVAESLDWNKNFDPGQSLIKKLAPSMSSRTLNKR